MTFDLGFVLFCIVLLAIIFGPGVFTHMRWRRHQRMRRL